METIWTFDSLGLTLISPQQCRSPVWKSARVQPIAVPVSSMEISLGAAIPTTGYF